ncbi:MAG: hypothetical protein AAB134_07095, partial [Pseudomonadota bacterium]
MSRCRGDRDGGGVPPDMSWAALETLLSRAEPANKPPPAGFEASQFSLFGIAKEEHTDLPVAAVTRVLDMGVIDNGWWLRADPVHLSLERDSLVLADASRLDVTPEEAGRLVAEIMEVFKADGWVLKAPRPDRWYLKPVQTQQITTTPLSEVVGQDIHPYLPQGPGGKAWHTTLNEIQILLHTATANVERERNGKLPINSLWFWGGGILPRIKPVSWVQVWSAEPVSLALARLSGTPSENPPSSFDEWMQQVVKPGDHLVVLDEVHDAVLSGDQQEWITAVQGIEQAWMAPLLSTLKKSGLGSASLLTDAGQGFSLTPRMARRWWRRRRPLAK